jgi:hypothetical protein
VKCYIFSHINYSVKQGKNKGSWYLRTKRSFVFARVALTFAFGNIHRVHHAWLRSDDIDDQHFDIWSPRRSLSQSTISITVMKNAPTIHNFGVWPVEITSGCVIVVSHDQCAGTGAVKPS